MRSYPRNSPEAAARIVPPVALVLISDGNIGSAKFEAIDTFRQPGQVGKPNSHRACSVSE